VSGVEIYAITVRAYIGKGLAICKSEIFTEKAMHQKW
jgi:hypothetical protein